MDGNPTLKQALELIRNREFDYARSILVEVLRDEPENATAWFLLSHVLDDPKRQEYALLQALKADPGFERAQSRLEVLRGKEHPAQKKEIQEQEPFSESVEPQEDPELVPVFMDEPEEPISSPELEQGQPPEDSLRDALEGWAPEEGSLAEPKERRPINWARLLIIALSIPVLAGLLVFGWQFVQSRPAASGPSMTPIASRTLAPTWTPTGASEAVATVEPTPVAQAQGLGEDVELQLQAIRQQVVDLRGLEIGEVSNALLSQDQVVPFMVGAFLGQDQAEAASDQENVLRSFGLLGTEDNILDLALNRQADPFAGFYNPADKTIYLLEQELSSDVQLGYSRLVGRAALGVSVDGLDGRLSTCPLISDMCVALRAVALGDSALAGAQWQAAIGGDGAAQDTQGQGAFLVQVQPPADYVAVDLAFPYQQGMAFVQQAFDVGGWPAVDDLYADLPASSEQIMHPDKYSGGEAAIAVDDSSAIEVLGGGWREAGKETVGEWMTYLILAHGASAETRISADAAITAAAGWGGDQYQAYWRESDQTIAVAAHWVMDSPQDAAELRAAFDQILSARFSGASPIGSGTCWADEEQRACLYFSGSDVLWLQGPDEIVVLQVLLAQYPQFQ